MFNHSLPQPLNFKKLGQAQGQIPPLVVLHGLFGMLDNWMSLARLWANNFEVWLVDQRNHGKSAHTAAFDYFLLADDLLQFFEQHHITKAHVLGHSMGGKTAMQFATLHPNRMASLMVADIAPKAYEAGHHSNVLQALKQVNLTQITTRQQANEALQTFIPDEGTRQFLLKNLTHNSQNQFVWKFNIDSLLQNYDTIINNPLPPFAHYNGPCLFIKGGASDYINLPDDEVLIHSHFSHAIVKTIENAGHWVHASHPQEVYHLVESFILSA